MISIDSNILLHALNEDSPSHPAAYAWIVPIQRDENVAISEFILAGLHCLLRNPAVLRDPMAADEAVAVIESRPLHDALWNQAALQAFPSRRIYDARSALTMIDQEPRTKNQEPRTKNQEPRTWNISSA